MKNIAIILTDNEGINEKIFLKSYKKLIKSKIQKFYLIGDKKLFPKIFNKTSNKKKFIFINKSFVKKKYFEYLNQITDEALKLYKYKKIRFLINLPLNKKKFLKNKFPGFTEYFSNKCKSKNKEFMLLYNEKFSVCPITTHIKIKNVSKNIKREKIILCSKTIVDFYKKIIKRKIKIKVLGLNPHCGMDDISKNEESVYIIPAIKKLKKLKFDVSGPYSADTAFSKFSKTVYLGMYHDQVLIPFKIINKFNGINITIGSKFLRLSPDHGIAKNLKRNINNKSFIKCIEFCEKY